MKLSNTFIIAGFVYSAC